MPLIDLWGGSLCGLQVLKDQFNSILNLGYCAHGRFRNKRSRVVRFRWTSRRRLQEHDWIGRILLAHLVAFRPRV